MHNGELTLEDVTLFESFQSDEKRGIPPMKGFEDTPWGTWFGSMVVNNEQVWEEQVKTGKLKGFSVEGMFNYKPKEVTQISALINEVKNILSQVK